MKHYFNKILKPTSVIYKQYCFEVRVWIGSTCFDCLKVAGTVRDSLRLTAAFGKCTLRTKEYEYDGSQGKNKKIQGKK